MNYLKFNQSIQVLTFFRLRSNACQEKREETTHSSEVGLSDKHSDKIPPPRFQPSKEPVLFSPQSHIPVYFDLETTGIGTEF